MMAVSGSRALVLGAVLSLAIGSPALAQQFNWAACDGYGAASGGGDGMTGYANVWLIFNPPGYGNTARSDVGQGDSAAAAAVCTRALEALAPAHWRRRVNLLQARALHRADFGEAEGALEDLALADEAATAGAGDVLFERSQGVGLMLSRAFVLSRLERNDEAREWLTRAMTARPYDRGVAAIVAAFPGAGTDPAFARAALEHRARLEPRARGIVAADLFDQRRFTEFLAIAPYLAPPWNYPPVNETYLGQALRELRDHEQAIKFRVSVDAMTGYAETAMGRYEAADQAFRRARTTLAAGGDAPEPPTLTGRDLEVYSNRIDQTWNRLKPIRAVIEEMEQVSQRRRRIAQGEAEAVLQSLPDDPLAADAAGVDILLALAEALPAEAAEARAAADRMVAASASRANKFPVLKLSDMFAAMPAAETAGRLAPWREAGRPFLASRDYFVAPDSMGYREKTSQDGVVTVRFRGDNSPQTQVEEMALLRAAQLARAGGHVGFVLLDRRDTEWTDQTTYYGVPLRTDPNGFESEIDLRFVDAETAAASGGMSLSADDVFAALAPIYLREQPRR